MDPLSALAGLLIASALKNIIELAQKLDESLAKVSTYPFVFAYLTEFQQVEKNMTKSKRLAGDKSRVFASWRKCTSDTMRRLFGLQS